nr:hypothetical protein [Sulfuriflexus mobilis]
MRQDGAQLGGVMEGLDYQRQAAPTRQADTTGGAGADAVFDLLRARVFKVAAQYPLHEVVFDTAPGDGPDYAPLGLDRHQCPGPPGGGAPGTDYGYQCHGGAVVQPADGGMQDFVIGVAIH